LVFDNLLRRSEFAMSCLLPLFVQDGNCDGPTYANFQRLVFAIFFPAQCQR
jgi:hypothetical protein